MDLSGASSFDTITVLRRVVLFEGRLDEADILEAMTTLLPEWNVVYGRTTMASLREHMIEMEISTSDRPVRIRAGDVSVTAIGCPGSPPCG